MAWQSTTFIYLDATTTSIAITSSHGRTSNTKAIVPPCAPYFPYLGSFPSISLSSLASSPSSPSISRPLPTHSLASS